MNTMNLAKSYLVKAQTRLEILDLLLEKEGYSDVVRESQEIVELSCKAMLRAIGIDPPKFHDVSDIMLEYKDRFPEEAKKHLADVARFSKLLRKERELAFYGDIDFIPTEEYSEEDARKAIDQAKFVVSVAKQVVS